MYGLKKTMEKVLIVCSCVVLSLNVVCGQYAQSPCPDIFEYGSDGSTIYGKIVLRPSAPVSQLDVRTNFTVATQLLSVSILNIFYPLIITYYRKRYLRKS